MLEENNIISKNKGRKPNTRRQYKKPKFFKPMKLENIKRNNNTKIKFENFSMPKHNNESLKPMKN
jgi:hypothetical protein